MHDEMNQPRHRGKKELHPKTMWWAIPMTYLVTGFLVIRFSISGRVGNKSSTNCLTDRDSRCPEYYHF
jgi:hypothetical protein